MDRYDPELRSENELISLARTHSACGLGLCYMHLRNVKGYLWSHTRAHRNYREFDLKPRLKPREQIKRETPERISVPAEPNVIWPYKFMTKRMEDAKAFWFLNVQYDFNREWLGIEADLSLPADRVTRTLGRIIELRRRPLAIRVDNGPEAISGTLLSYVEKRGINAEHIHSIKTQQSSYIEQYKRAVCHQWLGQ